jgi:Ca-activated chloride channel family protein
MIQEWQWLHLAPGGIFAVLCIVFLLSIALVWIRAWRRRPATVRFNLPWGPAVAQAAAGSWVTRLRFLVPLIRTLALLCLIYALARPQAGGAIADQAEGIAIAMVLDVSGSMAETDFALNGRWVRRLDAVKEVFRRFVLGSGDLSGRPNDLIGMVTFAAYADVRCPLTRDHGNLADLLRDTEIPGFVNGQQVLRHPEAANTALGDAIVLATDQLRRAREQAVEGIPGADPAQSTVMILLTDGKDHPRPEPGYEPPDPVKAAELAAALGIKIYTIGAVGSGQTQRRQGFFFAPVAEVDEVTLQKIAKETGGQYFRATDTDSLMTVYDEIDKLERGSTGEREYYDDVAAARTAMLIGLGLLMFELLLSCTRFRSIP